MTVSDTPTGSTHPTVVRLTVTACDGATRVSKREPDPCGLDGCEEPSIRKSLYCETHTHAWIAAAEVPIDNGRVAGAVRRAAAELKEHTWVKVLDVYCQSCRKTFVQARDTPCDSYSTVLRGGPIGTRKRRVDDQDDDAVFPAERGARP